MRTAGNKGAWDPARRNEVSPFRRRVYEELLRVPRGTVITYGELARRIGCGSAQAVGQALRHNPFAPMVPCHRVVAADGGLHGFNGQTGGPELARKRRLLAAEGVGFDAQGRARIGKTRTAGQRPAAQDDR